MSPARLSHLDRLEAESIENLREVAAECRNPVMLYSIGKDSSVLLHLLLKAFHPAPKPPISLLHVDTGWKFREIAFRDRRAAGGVDQRAYANPDGVAKGIGPISHKAPAAARPGRKHLSRRRGRQAYDQPG